MNNTDYGNKNDDYNDSLSITENCTIFENNIDTIVPTLLLKLPCGLSF